MTLHFSHLLTKQGTWADDDFTGDTLNSSIWMEHNVGTGSSEIQGEKLRVELGATSNDMHEGAVYNLGILKGNCTVQVDVDGVVMAASNGWGARLWVEINAFHAMFIQMRYHFGNNYEVGYINGAGALYPDQDPRTYDVCSLKIVRTGNVFQAYYDDGRLGSWVELNAGGQDLGAGDAFAALIVQNWSNYPATTIDFDNFEITTGNPVQSTDGQTHYSTDFSEYSIGSQPSDWTERWHTTVAASEVQASGLQIRHTSGERYALSWDDVGDVEEVEILVRAKTNTGDDASLRVYLCGSGTSTTEGGYFMEVYPGTSVVKGYRYQNGGAAQIGENFTKTLTTGTWYFFRFRNERGLLRLKIWEDGSSEPNAWDLRAPGETLIGSGWVGVGSYRDSSDFNWFSVATNGATAQSPA